MKNLLKIILISILILLVTACNNSNSIIGNWVRVDDETKEYIFYKNNEGKYISDGITKDFIYEDRGTKILIKFSDEEITNEYDYHISDNILTINASLNIALKRK